jgi:hypothetical protein
MAEDAQKNWQELCREAIDEKDPDKLMAIVTELNRVLEGQENKKVAKSPSGC